MQDCRFVDLDAIIAEGRQVTVLWQEEESLAFVANGRTYRSEFHVNPSSETMLQLRGEMRLHYLTPEGEERVRVLREGE
jgi:3-hydroxyanthranilate 3,4-dioxygenase